MANKVALDAFVFIESGLTQTEVEGKLAEIYETTASDICQRLSQIREFLA